MIDYLEEKIDRVGLTRQTSLREQTKQDIINRWIQSLEGFQDNPLSLDRKR